MKKNKSSAVMEMLKKGLSVKQIKERIAVSESYIYLAKKKLADMADEAITEATAALKEACTFTPEEVGIPNEAFFKAVLAASQGKGKPEPGEYIVVEGAKSAQEVDAILNERATTYGTFLDNARVAQEMKNAIRMCNNSELDDDQIEALDMIASKIARIVNGDPNHIDSWIDIAGYATLVADRLQGEVR
jgi:hypothetical protein